MGTYLITGASSGIGAACATQLSRDGHVVVLVARQREKLENFAATLPGAAHCFAYDLENVDGVKDIFEFCRDRELKLDGMLYAAGMLSDTPLKVCTSDIFAKVMRLNFLAFAEMGRLFYKPRFSNDFSRIVAISSAASLLCDKGMGAYSASKAAMNALVKTMSKEFIKRGFLINAVLPGGVMTPMSAAKIEMLTGHKIDVQEEIQKIESAPPVISEHDEQPCGIILPSYVARIACYLLSAENRYMTGELVPISGGLPL